MDVYLRTRGTEMDYRFIGDTPKAFWWREYKRRGLTDDEKLVIFVESEAGTGAAGWRVYLQGVESRRRDNRGTPIAFNIVMSSGNRKQGDRDDPADREFALRLIGLWLEDAIQPPGRSTAAERLDEVLPATTVDHWLETGVDPESARAAEQAVRTAFSSEKGPPIAVSASKPPHWRWLGDLSDEESRKAFLSHVKHLLDGRPGKALILTSVQAADDPAVADLVAEETGDLALLAARRGRTPIEGMSPLGKAEPVLPADGEDHPDRRPRPVCKKRLPLVVVAAATAVVAALIAWLILTRTGNAAPLPTPGPTSMTTTSGPGDSQHPSSRPAEMISNK